MRTDRCCKTFIHTHSTSYVVVVSIFLALLAIALTGRYLVTKRVVDTSRN